MAQPQAKETICKHCGELFPSKGTYQVHFRRNHQNDIKAQTLSTVETTTLRSETQKFECICGESYEIYQSISRHQNSCQQWKTYQTDQEGLEMEIQGINL